MSGNVWHLLIQEGLYSNLPTENLKDHQLYYANDIGIVYIYDEDTTTWKIFSTDINSLPVLSLPVKSDKLMVFDASLSALRGITLENSMKFISDLSEQSSPANTDLVAVQQASDGEIRKVQLSNLPNSGGSSSSNGWIDADEIWTFSSVDDPSGVITISGDVTEKYSKGMRIKFDNGGNTIYGIISVDPAYSSPNTTLTFLHEIDPSDSQALNLMENSAISNNYYSREHVPHGFPTDKRCWELSSFLASSAYVSSPTQNEWYQGIGGGPFSITLAPGAWRLSYQVLPYFTMNSGITSGRIIVTLSTSTDSESDFDFTTTLYQNGQYAYLPVRMEKNIVLTSKTTYNFLMKAPLANTNMIGISGSYHHETLKAEFGLL